MDKGDALRDWQEFVLMRQDKADEKLQFLDSCFYLVTHGKKSCKVDALQDFFLYLFIQ